MKKAISKAAAALILKNRRAHALNLGKIAILGAVLGTGAEAFFGGDKKNQAALLEKLKAEGVVGTGPNQLSEEEFQQHMERGSNGAFSPLETGLESAGLGGVVGGLITPFLGGDKKAAISNNIADMIRQYQAMRAGRARIKEDTGFELNDEKSLDELYGKENAFGNAESVDFTSSPLGWLMGDKKAPTLGRGGFATSEEGGKNKRYFKTEKDRSEFVDWSNNSWDAAKKSNDPKVIEKALRGAPEGFRKTADFLNILHSTFKKGYKGSDITSESGKKDFKSFVQGILPAGGTFDPATGRGTPTPVDPSRRTPAALLSNYLSPEGYEWDSEDAYKQSGMAPNDMLGNKPASSSSSVVTAKPVGPTDVMANANMPQAPATTGDAQANYIRSNGGMTANDQGKQQRNFADAAYNKAYPNEQVGSQAAYDAALQRIRPNVLQASGVREFNNTKGGIGGYSTLPDAIVPQSMANNSAGVTYRERAYGKHFATPEAGTNGTPYVSGGNWTGNNPMTGDFKDPDGGIWTAESAFRNSQKGEAGLNSVTDPPVMDYGPHDDQLPSERKKYNTDRTFSFLRARVRANAAGDNSLDGMSSDEYHNPDFAHSTKGPEMGYGSADPSAGYNTTETDPRYNRTMRLPERYNPPPQPRFMPYLPNTPNDSFSVPDALRMPKPRRPSPYPLK